MKINRFVWISLMVVWLLGCALGPSPMNRPRKHYPERLPDQVAAESKRLGGIQERLQRDLQHRSAPSINAQPVMPAYDPLEDQMVSFSMIDEDLQKALYSLSQAIGINFIIDPEAVKEERKLTLSFEQVSAATVLREILAAYDLYYTVDGNLIRIAPFKEQMFRLAFLDTQIDTKFEVGGDVLGAGETETATGLTGSFKVTGKGSRQPNAYDALENMVKPLISEGGKFSINRMSGSLYVKDRPAVIRSVARMVHHLNKMMSRQILIEARIIEIILSDQYRFGIDWDILRNLTDAATELTEVSWSLGDGLLLSGTSGELSFGATVDALNMFGDVTVVSNPTIRSKHGQPAMMSVGKSITYKKSVETTRTSIGSTQDTTTSVEVSTVFDGLILGVVPFIDETGRITLLINPIKSDVDEDSLEPEDVGENDSISLPQVRIKELSSTIAMNNGDVAILGGLIDKRLITDNQGVPFLSAIPVLGYLFKDEDEREEHRELVIVLSVKLV